MTRRLVTTRECDRCPRNRKPNPATHIDEPFTFGDVRWVIDLCDDCYARMERELYSWGRLGREVEEPAPFRRFTEETKERGLRLAELRTSQAQTRPEPETPKQLTKAMHFAGPIPEGLPADAGDWVFTDHAVDRMKERHVSALKILRVVCKPHIQRPGRTPDTMVYEGHGIKVVVKPDTLEIVTVGKKESEERQAHSG